MYFMLQIVCFACAYGLREELPSDFNDQILYDISWNDPLNSKSELVPGEKVFMMTKESERYQCIIPDVKEDSDADLLDDGISPESLLLDLMKSSSETCSLRLELYWTYKLCHGRQFVQYHEESSPMENGKTEIVVKHEYVLGEMSKDDLKEFAAKAKRRSDKEHRKVTVRKINDKDTPYFSVEMANGTPCDLNGRSRRTSVIYICHPTANNEIMSIKEVTTCEYEVIVLSPALCHNDNYRIKGKLINDIRCHSYSGSPRKPLNLIEHGDQLSGGRRQVPLKVPPYRTNQKPEVDKDINRKFLSGDYCLVGGSGWWRFEFCYGKYIQQYHVEPNRQKTYIKLGFWNKEKHISWYKKQTKRISDDKHAKHYYSEGDVCDLTGKPRSAVVSLICLSVPGQQMMISMTEDKPCEYQVNVESPILCPLLKSAGEYGIF